MKKILYTLGLISILASCRSINKMIDKGDYDGAFEFAVNKLESKRKKKTDHVMGLEKALRELNQRDLDKISSLNENPSPRNWDRVEQVAQIITRRQTLLDPLLPLVSKEGYEAHFEFVDTEAIITSARLAGAEYYYNLGKKVLEEAKTNNNKRLAKTAYKNFNQVSDRAVNYKNTNEMRHEAHQLGIMHHLIRIENSIGSYVPARLLDELDYLDVSQMDNFWNKYYLTSPDDLMLDRAITLDVRELIIDPEREIVTYHTDRARVKDGYRYLKDKKGKILKDTLGNKLKEPKYKDVIAEITEVYREKFLILHSEYRVTDNKTNQTVSSRPLSIEIAFEDKSSSFIGDRRAICDKGHGGWKEYPAAFPSDEFMISDAVGQLKFDFKKALNEI